MLLSYRRLVRTCLHALSMRHGADECTRHSTGSTSSQCLTAQPFSNLLIGVNEQLRRYVLQDALSDFLRCLNARTRRYVRNPAKRAVLD